MNPMLNVESNTKIELSLYKVTYSESGEWVEQEVVAESEGQILSFFPDVPLSISRLGNIKFPIVLRKYPNTF